MTLWIHLERKRKKLTQAELANKIGVSRQTLNAIERGRVQLTVVVALKMSRIFKVPIEKFCELDKEEEP